MRDPAILDNPFLNTPRVGVSIVERKLTLQQAAELALRNNLDIEIQRIDRASADQLVRAAQGAFDPVFRIQPGYERRNTPVASPLQAQSGTLEERFVTWAAGLGSRLPWSGSSIQASFDNGRQTTNNGFVTLVPYFTSRLGFTFTQPLWRNRETDQFRSEIRIRQRRTNISDLDLELRVIDIVNRVEQAYWNLAAIRQDILVEAEAVKLAGEQLARTDRMIQSGTMAQVELSASRAELERRIDAYYASVQQWTDIENALKLLIAPGREDDLWRDQIVPIDTQPTTASDIVELKETLDEALKSRPELRQLSLRQDVNQIEQRRERNATKPEINLVAGYYNQGLAGSQRSGDNFFTLQNQQIYTRLNELSNVAGLPPVVPPTTTPIPGNLVGGYGQTLGNVFGLNYQTLQAGLAIDWTLKNRTAEANLALTALTERRLKIERARAEQLIESDVRGALQAIQAARQRIQAANAFERASLERLQSETRLFGAGESTNFFVQQRQRDYIDARRAAVVAQLEYNRAVGRLGVASGRTLRTFNISLK
jgi:outer membrane protein TolC